MTCSRIAKRESVKIYINGPDVWILPNILARSLDDFAGGFAARVEEIGASPF